MVFHRVWVHINSNMSLWKKGDTAVTLAALKVAYKRISPASHASSACRVDDGTHVAYGYQFDRRWGPPYRGLVVLENDFRRMLMTPFQVGRGRAVAVEWPRLKSARPVRIKDLL